MSVLAVALLFSGAFRVIASGMTWSEVLESVVSNNFGFRAVEVAAVGMIGYEKRV